MADMELKIDKDKAILDFAKCIKSAQDSQIKQMQAWLKSKDVK